MSNLNWEHIKVLGVVARFGTVRAAARELKVHHATISRNIESLERDAGVNLVNRTPEGYMLTEAGTLLADSAAMMSDHMTRAQRLITGDDKALAGRILVTMAMPVAVYAFAPRMSTFQETYPNLEIEITSSTRMIDLARRKADVAIRMNNNPPESLFGKRLFSYYNTVYAAPDYLAKHDPKNEPGQCRLLGFDDSFSPNPAWVRDTEFQDVPTWGNFPDLDMQAALVAAGSGLAFLPCFIGDRDPRLVRATRRPPVRGREIWILTHPDLRNNSRIKAFMAFAEEVITDHRDLFEGKAVVSE